jgi:hypothetical protein
MTLKRSLVYLRNHIFDRYCEKCRFHFWSVIKKSSGSSLTRILFLCTKVLYFVHFNQTAILWVVDDTICARISTVVYAYKSGCGEPSESRYILISYQLLHGANVIAQNLCGEHAPAGKTNRLRSSSPFFSLRTKRTAAAAAAAASCDKKKKEREEIIIFHLMDKTTPTINSSPSSLRD